MIRHDITKSYLIERKTGFNRIANGVLQPKEFKNEKSVGVFDNASEQLREQRFGRIYSVTRSGDGLIIGKTFYRKIK